MREWLIISSDYGVNARYNYCTTAKKIPELQLAVGLLFFQGTPRDTDTSTSTSALLVRICVGSTAYTFAHSFTDAAMATYQAAKTQFVKVDGCTFAYRLFGLSHGVPLVFIPGFK